MDTHLSYVFTLQYISSETFLTVEQSFLSHNCMLMQHYEPVFF